MSASRLSIEALVALACRVEYCQEMLTRLVADRLTRLVKRRVEEV